MRSTSTGWSTPCSTAQPRYRHRRSAWRSRRITTPRSRRASSTLRDRRSFSMRRASRRKPTARAFNCACSSTPSSMVDSLISSGSRLRRVGIDAVIQPREFAAYVKQVYTDRQFDLTIESLTNVFDPTVGVQRGYWSKNFKPGLPFSNSARYESHRRPTGCSRPPRSRTIQPSARRSFATSST